MGLNKKINQTLFSENEKGYIKMKNINIPFAIIVSIFPMIINISKKLIPNLLVDILCAFFIFSPYIVEKLYGIIILEEFKF